MRKLGAFFVMISVMLLPVCSNALNINEIRTDNVGGDTDEFFELAGQPGEPLAGLTYLVIGDGALGFGVIESITDLTGLSIQSDGYLAVHKAGTTPVCSGYDVDRDLNFENNDNVTHLLVSGFSGAAGDQLDLDENGVLDITPWTAVLDDVALLAEVGGGDLVYSSTTVGPDGAYAPGLVIFCDGHWSIGSFDLCVHDSAGAPNDACAVSNHTCSFSRLKASYR